MNKKKSKALAFLLAASLLVPSANGIVSAAELEGSGIVAQEQLEGATGSDVVVQEQAESTTGSDAATGGETTEGVNPLDVKSAEELGNALAKEGVTEIVITKGFDVSKTINVDKAVTIKGANGVKLTGTSIFNITTDATISNLAFDNTAEDAGNVINVTNGATAKIEGCKFTGKKVINLIDCSTNSKLKFIGNTVELIARSMIVGVTNGSEIIGNTIDLQGERYSEGDGMRTGVLSVIAYGEEKEENKVIIEGNTFKRANRVIGMDNGSVQDGNMYIKNNKFIDCRFAVEVAPNWNNKGQEYNLENNYFEFGGKVGALKVQDAGKRDKKNDYKYSHEGSSAELVLDSLKDNKNIVKPYPYYSKLELDSTGKVIASESVKQTAVKVGEKSYNSLEEAIDAINKDTTQSKFNVVLQRDIELGNIKINDEKGIEIASGKIVRITSPSKHKIELMGSDLINIAEGGTLTLDNVELRANKDAINYIVQYGDLTINKCNITAIDSVKGITNIVKSGGADVKLVLTNSNISVNARGGFVAVGSGSVIKNNTIDLKGEKAATDGKRTGIISIVAKGDGKVEIVDNTFMDANRGIGVDWSDIKAENLTIKGNKFIDVRYAFEIDPTKANNQNRNYDLSRNYFRFDSKVSAPKIQDAHARDLQGANDFTYEQNDGSTEFVLGDYRGETFEKDLPSIKDGPYYTNENKTELSDGSHIPSIPSKPIKPVYDHTKVIGSDRYDTAAKIADKLGSYDNVVLVNATSTMSDGLSASGLAGKEDSAILLTKKDSIPKVTMDRIRKVKKVYIIGGEAAISAKVVNQITVAGVKVERIGGKNRVETSELVAKKIGNYKKAFVVNGFKGEDDAMSASSVAAREEAPILLTNGKSSTHAKKYGVKYYVVGGNSVVNKSIANKYNAEVLAGRDRYATNREVIAEFYGASETLYFANGETLVDALTASTIAKDKGLVLVGRNSDNDILNKKNTIQVGGMNFHIDFEK